jgi:hypothetical protein
MSQEDGFLLSFGDDEFGLMYREQHEAKPVHACFTSTEHLSELVGYDVYPYS